MDDIEGLFYILIYPCSYSA